jgi:hypothetical protein
MGECFEGKVRYVDSARRNPFQNRAFIVSSYSLSNILGQADSEWRLWNLLKEVGRRQHEVNESITCRNREGKQKLDKQLITGALKKIIPFLPKKKKGLLEKLQNWGNKAHEIRTVSIHFRLF